MLKANNADTPHLSELCLALGRLLVASGEMEARLRSATADLLVPSDDGDFIFEGQAVSWLRDSVGTYLRTMHAPGPKADHAKSLLQDAQDASRLRNLMVHGHWSKECDMPDWVVTSCGPRPGPAAAEPDDRIFHVSSSSRKNPVHMRAHQMVAVRDVEAVADSMLTLAVEIPSALSTLRN
ncbi:hypothetical protein ABT097_16215 [Streptomyces sp. NPDC002225]|uniref:hypothetical protein n=1 Tax=Streptomyces sp. NPDC002225 TaxID=3154413 RepID=UPI0033313900